GTLRWAALRSILRKDKRAKPVGVGEFNLVAVSAILIWIDINTAIQRRCLRRNTFPSIGFLHVDHIGTVRFSEISRRGNMAADDDDGQNLFAMALPIELSHLVIAINSSLAQQLPNATRHGANVNRPDRSKLGDLRRMGSLALR